MHLKASRKAGPLLRDKCTGAAWLPSARAVRRSLKWGNERNPCFLLHVVRKDCRLIDGGRRGWRQISMALWHPGLHTCYNGRYRGSPSRKAELIP